MTTESNLTLVSASPIATRSAIFPKPALLAAAAIVLSWLWLNRLALQWLAAAVGELSRFNLLLLAAAGVLLGVTTLRYRQQIRVSAVPVLRPAPTLLLLASGSAAVFCRWLLNFEQIPVLLFLLGTYGLLGCFLAPALWQRGIAVAAAIACIVPFGVQFSTGLGFPARVLTAHAVESLLSSLHIAALSSENIIVLDTGIARIDLPCSGLKSLWTGTLFLLAATGLEGRRLGGRWLLVCFANLLLLAIANIARVLALVVLFHVLRQPVVAEMLHVPLGLASFVSVCALTWMLLQLVPRDRHSPQEQSMPELQSHQQGGDRRGLAALGQPIGLVVCLLLLSWVPAPAAVVPPLDLAQLHWPPALQTQPISLNPVEQDFFANHPGVVAQKQRFQFQTLSGDIVLVSSSSWRAHHAPELCLVSSGWQVSHMEQRSLTPELLGRWLSLNGGQQAATYWFQSPNRTTDAFLSRIWGEVTRTEPTWILVSILFDRPQFPNDGEVKAFLNTVYSEVDHAFHQG